MIESGQEEFERLIGRSDLPELGDKDPIRTLGIRLDREADLWRAFALGALARAAWIDQVVQWVAIITFIGTLGLAFVGWAGALLGPAGSGQRALLVCAGVVALTVGAGLMWLVGRSIRRANQQTARESLSRADLAELRLHRVAVLMGLRAHDANSFTEALQRLERDITLPPR